MADGGEVDADLVRTARHRLHLKKGEGAELLTDAVLRLRLAAAGDDGHLLAVPGVPAEGRLDDALFRLGSAVHQGQVRLAHLPLLQLACELGSGALAPGDDEEARGVLVEAVDDAGPHRVAEGRQLGRRRQQGVDQRPAGVSRRRVDGEPGGLIDDDDVFVLVDDGDRDRLRRRLRLLRGRDGSDDSCAGGQSIRRALLPSVHRHQARGDETAGLTAGEALGDAGEEDV